MIVINIKIGAFRSRIDNVAHELNSTPYQVEIGSRFLIAGVGYVPAHMERCVREEKYDTPFFWFEGSVRTSFARWPVLYLPHKR